MANSTKKADAKATDLLDALDIYFSKHLYATFRELRVEAEPTKGASFSRIDYYAMPYYNHTPPREELVRPFYAIEVKVDRTDFTKELKKPQKQRWALMYSNLFYYCAPRGLIALQELPPYSGLLEFDNSAIVQKIAAPWRDAMPPRWTFVASLLVRSRHG